MSAEQTTHQTADQPQPQSAAALAPADHTALELAMCDYDRGDPRRIQHFVKVRAFARTIALAEGADPATLHTLEAAALVHDAGIHESERRYGDTAGPHQEELGPQFARPMLEAAGYPAVEADRICWLVAHHHHYADIADLDHQILVEADFLVNIYEDAPDDPAKRRRMAASVRERVFRTATGTRLLDDLFLATE